MADEDGTRTTVVCYPPTRYVRLNVGGQLFLATVSTLTSRRDSRSESPETMFQAMFSGRLPVRVDADGYVLLDRCGCHFATVLNWLRDGEAAPLPARRQEIMQLRNEATFYLITDLVKACDASLARLPPERNGRVPLADCQIPLLANRQEVTDLIRASKKPVIKLLVNRHNNKYSYTQHSDDNMLKNLELFEKLARKFHDRILFIKDLGTDSPEVCQWSFYGAGRLVSEVCCTSIVYATDRKQTKVELPESKVYDEAISVLRFEDRTVCARCQQPIVTGEPSTPSNASGLSLDALQLQHHPHNHQFHNHQAQQEGDDQNDG